MKKNKESVMEIRGWNIDGSPHGLALLYINQQTLSTYLCKSIDVLYDYDLNGSNNESWTRLEVTCYELSRSVKMTRETLFIHGMYIRTSNSVLMTSDSHPTHWRQQTEALLVDVSTRPHDPGCHGTGGASVGRAYGRDPSDWRACCFLGPGPGAPPPLAAPPSLTASAPASC
jgi:hypothetical protein